MDPILILQIKKEYMYLLINISHSSTKSAIRKLTPPPLAIYRYNKDYHNYQLYKAFFTSSFMPHVKIHVCTCL